MRVFAPSLALILLEVCRLSSAEMISWGYVDIYADSNMGTGSSFSLAPEVKADQINKFVLGNVSGLQQSRLTLLLGNTIYAMVLERLGMYENLPGYYRMALDNGVLCEMFQGVSDETIKALQYQADELTDEQRISEVEAAKDPAIGIDCSAPDSSADRLFCLEMNSLLYCAALKFRERIMEKGGLRWAVCESDILKSFPKGSASYVGIYFDDNYNEQFVRSFKNFDDFAGTGIQADRYCMVDTPEAEDAVMYLFGSNALRWTLEGYVIEEVFDGKYKDIDGACAVESFVTSEVGKCACRSGTGISFCIEKTRAQYFKKIGYLTCNGDKPFFNASKKPSPIAPFSCMSNATAATGETECRVVQAHLM